MQYPSPRRSSLITLSSVLLIVLVTLIPFNFTAEGVTFTWAVHSFFIHASGMSDIVGNVFLFMPFGIDLAYEFRRRRVNQGATLFAVAGLSALLSLSVETLQVFLPIRSSSWIDICTNTLGGAIGAIVYLRWKQNFPKSLRTITAWIRRRLSPQLWVSLMTLWVILASGICLLLQHDLKIGLWNFTISFMFVFYSILFVPLGILLALMVSLFRTEPRLYLMLSSIGIVVPAFMIEVLLRGADIRRVNIIVSMMIALFTLLIVRSRFGHLLRN